MSKNINQLRILLILGIFVASVFVLIKFPINLGLDLQGGTRLVYEGEDTEKVKVSDDSMAGVAAVIRNRIDGLGVSEPTIQRKGVNQVIVELPGIKDPERAIALIGDTALLEFVEAEWLPGDARGASPEKVKEFYGADARIDSVKDMRDGRVESERPIVLKKTVLTGADLKGAFPSFDQYGNPVVDIEFNDKGAQIFAEVTGRSVNKPLAIILDKRIISAPNVREPIPSGRAQISGSFKAEDVRDMVIKLKAGSLPIPVKMVETRIVGPSLGKDSIDRSTIAGILGFVFIIIFMIVYYRLPGFIAILSLGIYVPLTLAVLALFHTTLTLPGIAGFLLSIGMAVDANVIIFERLKEELRLGKTVKASFSASFDRAFSAILDSNVTTIIGALTLFFVGTGTIRGFAVTLAIGIVISMFTALTLTRMMLNLLVDAKIVTDPKSKMLYK
ncbi:protein-export membrane protein SecD [candidate division WOR-1 bacterium RIFOXYA12_FULL_52_29]|uniref:Protein translocase subunit SecD n=1 Tax=candidate division WOR-1 bacterium RIFOXYC12_FULL_54_18 TaxID=1802584 RepID=A0A1F4T6E6_UNCSA|nr:MAG: protein-export membrane protein SecD [candidate division WOR-1 bacterium RIFOXYA2_FULL_51_19]OGC17723.1 MAG: protein-export membrane protein SecD [candidate division WOR-1 bacterium RIFOXYA12_FULL_52_29]OGC26580.1 MAG: protein-export membrane protein SecD [candidate division WOR-1 bacterium RIFOXYB2_FULL_45_9]OGC28140.1 MAG: protein-export membrane protein SecD [candidate division WOR-1 bacterium RIFOXYC12_FULL_54_18]OGC29574.1 MAG: protein-export membrane protein SecD [candidate divisi